jgi:hypothetical protein
VDATAASTPVRRPGADVRLSEVVGALTYALDITEGLPMGHAARSCAIGMRLAAVIGLPSPQRSALFYALLLKDAGCSVNSSRVAELYGADDAEVKRDRKTLDQHRPAELAAHLLRTAAPGAGPIAKAGRIKALVRNGAEGSRQLTAMRCERGADIARMVGVGESAALAIRALDEHWDGSGGPDGLRGDDIPMLGRILCLSQTVEVFHARDGAHAACEMARDRAGTWFDPELVQALGTFEADSGFWSAWRATTNPPWASATSSPRTCRGSPTTSGSTRSRRPSRRSSTRSRRSPSGTPRASRSSPSASPTSSATPRAPVGTCGGPRCCTTWASSGSPTGSSTSRASSTTPSGARCAGIPSTPSTSSAG